MKRPRVFLDASVLFAAAASATGASRVVPNMQRSLKGFLTLSKFMVYFL